MKTSKRHLNNREKRAKPAPLPLPEAIETLRTFQPAKFNETVEIVVRTGIDPKQTTQSLRGAFSLPHGIGKSVKVIAFCEGDDAKAAMTAGALEAGGEALAKKIEGGWTDFDVAVAHPSMMRFVGKLGRVLGPQGKMPSPKSGTVTTDIGRVVQEFAAGKIEFRNDAAGIVHAPMGKRDFAKEHLVANIQAFLDHLSTLRPSGAKGTFIRRVYIKATMSPSVPVFYDSGE